MSHIRVDDAVRKRLVPLASTWVIAGSGTPGSFRLHRADRLYHKGDERIYQRTMTLRKRVQPLNHVDCRNVARVCCASHVDDSARADRVSATEQCEFSHVMLLLCRPGWWFNASQKPKF
jgi:hypothetical protein